MPLLTSPIDGSPMRQIHRYGIEIDVCPTSGGIWLDKGELEKLMALLREEVANEPPMPSSVPASMPPAASAPRGRSYRDDDDDDDDYRRSHKRDDYRRDDYKRDDYRYKNKSKMSKIMDIFDF